MRHTATTIATALSLLSLGVAGCDAGPAASVAPEVATVTVTPSTWTVSAGASCQFTATAWDANGNPVPGVAFQWVSSDTNVALVDSTGLARGVGRGHAIISATARGHLDDAVLSVAFPAGRLVVASDSDNAVYLYDPVTLTRLSTFDVMRPLSAAVGPDDRIYAGTYSGRIVAWNPTTGDTATLGVGILSGFVYGTTVSAAGVIYASGSGMANVPTLDLVGVPLDPIVPPAGSGFRATAFGPDGAFYLTAFSGGPVQWWHADFEYQGAFGGGGLSAAFGIATRANGEVVVTDQNQAAYFRFSREGVFLGSVSVNCAGQLRNVTVDQGDNVWVGCYGANAVVKFDPLDHEVARLTVNSPSGVAFERP